MCVFEMELHAVQTVFIHFTLIGSSEGLTESTLLLHAKFNVRLKFLFYGSFNLHLA